MKNYYKPGSWNAVCSRCGFKFKSDELREDWQGLMVCSKDFETRHPADLLRVSREDTTTAWSRPEPTDSFVGVASPLIIETNPWLEIYTENGIILQTEG